MEAMKKLLKSFAVLLLLISGSSNRLSAQSAQEISQEIDNILLSGGKLLNFNDIQSSVMDQLSSLLTSQLAASLGSSPISEVSALKSVVSEAYTKQQKLIATQIEIEQEKNAAMTTISPQVASYYNELNLSGRFSELSQKSAALKQKIGVSKPMNAGTKDLFLALLDKNAQCDDLKAKIRTSTNQNGQVWMSEAERVQVISGVSDQLDKKIAFVKTLSDRTLKLERDYNKYQARRTKSQNVIK